MPDVLTTLSGLGLAGATATFLFDQLGKWRETQAKTSTLLQLVKSLLMSMDRRDYAILEHEKLQYQVSSGEYIQTSAWKPIHVSVPDDLTNGVTLNFRSDGQLISWLVNFRAAVDDYNTAANEANRVFREYDMPPEDSDFSTLSKKDQAAVLIYQVEPRECLKLVFDAHRQVRWAMSPFFLVEEQWELIFPPMDVLKGWVQV